MPRNLVLMSREFCLTVTNGISKEICRKLNSLMFRPQDFISVWQVLRRNTENFHNAIYDLLCEMYFTIYIVSRMKTDLPQISITTRWFSVISMTHYNMVGVVVAMVISTMHEKSCIDSHNARKFE